MVFIKGLRESSPRGQRQKGGVGVLGVVGWGGGGGKEVRKEVI